MIFWAEVASNGEILTEGNCHSQEAFDLQPCICGGQKKMRPEHVRKADGWIFQNNNWVKPN